MKTVFVVGTGVAHSAATGARARAFIAAMASRGEVEVVQLASSGTAWREGLDDSVLFRTINHRRGAMRWRLDLGRALKGELDAASLRHGDLVVVVERELVAMVVSVVWARLRRVLVTHELTEHPGILGTLSGKVRMVALHTILLRSMSFVLAISSGLEDWCKRAGCRNVIVTGPVVERSLVNRQFQHDGIFRVGYAGSLSDEKDGVLDLIRAMAIVADASTFDPTGLSIEVFGGRPGSPDYQIVLQEAEAVGVGGLLVMHGFVDQAVLPARLARFDVLVLPRRRGLQSRYGFPTKLAEYLQTGVPVVTSDVGDIPTRVADNVNGLVYPAGDVETLAKRICWVKDNPSRSKELGAKGRALANEHWGPTALSSLVLDAVEKAKCS